MPSLHHPQRQQASVSLLPSLPSSLRFGIIVEKVLQVLLNLTKHIKQEQACKNSILSENLILILQNSMQEELTAKLVLNYSSILTNQTSPTFRDFLNSNFFN